MGRGRGQEQCKQEGEKKHERMALAAAAADVLSFRSLPVVPLCLLSCFICCLLFTIIATVNNNPGLDSLQSGIVCVVS